MPGRVKCEPGCTCEKHNRQRMSEEVARERRREISRKHYERNRAAILEREQQERRDPETGDEKRRKERERIAGLPPEEKARRAQLNRDWYQRNPRSSAEATKQHLMHRYKLTPAGRQSLLDAQGGCCYLCGDPLALDEPRKVHIEHDHACCSGNTACGKCIRGIACDPCNRGIGYFYDDPDRMERVAANLRAAQVSRQRAAELARTAAAPCPQATAVGDRRPAMAGQQGLGRVFDVVYTASGNYISLKNASAVSFVCKASGAMTAALTAATAFSGGTVDNWTTANGFGQVGFWYENQTNNGTGGWAKKTSSWSSNVLTLSGTTGYVSVFTVYTSELADTFDYIEVTMTNGAATALLHDLTVQRTPANLAVLGV